MLHIIIWCYCLWKALEIWFCVWERPLLEYWWITRWRAELIILHVSCTEHAATWFSVCDAHNSTKVLFVLVFNLPLMPHFNKFFIFLTSNINFSTRSCSYLEFTNLPIKTQLSSLRRLLPSAQVPIQLEADDPGEQHFLYLLCSSEEYKNISTF